jgi:hypothetical protein
MKTMNFSSFFFHANNQNLQMSIRTILKHTLARARYIPIGYKSIWITLLENSGLKNISNFRSDYDKTTTNKLFLVFTIVKGYWRLKCLNNWVISMILISQKVLTKSKSKQIGIKSQNYGKFLITMTTANDSVFFFFFLRRFILIQISILLFVFKYST